MENPGQRPGVPSGAGLNFKELAVWSLAGNFSAATVQNGYRTVRAEPRFPVGWWAMGRSTI